MKLRSTKSQMDAIAELISSQEETIIVSNKDPWGTDFEVQKSENNLRVVSAGPDKMIHTADDIVGKWHGDKKVRIPRDND